MQIHSVVTDTIIFNIVNFLSANSMENSVSTQGVLNQD